MMTDALPDECNLVEVARCVANALGLDCVLRAVHVVLRSSTAVPSSPMNRQKYI